MVSLKILQVSLGPSRKYYLNFIPYKNRNTCAAVLLHISCEGSKTSTNTSVLHAILWSKKEAHAFRFLWDICNHSWNSKGSITKTKNIYIVRTLWFIWWSHQNLSSVWSIYKNIYRVIMHNIMTLKAGFILETFKLKVKSNQLLSNEAMEQNTQKIVWQSVSCALYPSFC